MANNAKKYKPDDQGRNWYRTLTFAKGVTKVVIKNKKTGLDETKYSIPINSSIVKGSIMVDPKFVGFSKLAHDENNWFEKSEPEKATFISFSNIASEDAKLLVSTSKVVGDNEDGTHIYSNKIEEIKGLEVEKVLDEVNSKAFTWAVEKRQDIEAQLTKKTPAQIEKEVNDRVIEMLTQKRFEEAVEKEDAKKESKFSVKR